jgi:hypothetical protein
VQNIPRDEHPRNVTLSVYNRELLLHGSKRNEALSLAEIEQYGLDSFADPDYISIYGMSPREWYGCGVYFTNGGIGFGCSRMRVPQ